MRLTRIRVLRRAVAVVTVALATCSVVAGADARPSANERQAPTGAAARAVHRAATADAGTPVKGKYGIPPFPAPDANGNPLPYAGKAITDAYASKAKVNVRLPEITISDYATFCLAFPLPDGTAFDTCCPDVTDTTCDRVKFPATSVDDQGSVSWIRITGPGWVNSPAGHVPTFGTFPDVRVRALAFGSVPVEATVHLSQTVGDDGYYDPLDFFYEVESTVLPIGSTVDGYGTTPESPFVPGSGSFVYLPTSLGGKVNLRLSDLTVDGRAVDVGTHCRPVEPASLTLGAPGGFAGQSADDTPISAFRGRPGAFTTVPGSQLYGNLSIPAFSGCANGNEDLDPLLTSFVSSARNPVTATLTTTLDVCNSDGCPVLPQADSSTAAAVQERASVAEPLTAALGRPAVHRRLVDVLAKLPGRARAAALASLPAGSRAGIAHDVARQR